MRLEMTVEDFGAQGEGICRHEGMAVFVPRALPGEKILAQIVKVEKRHAFARVVQVLEASPSRVEPPCPHYVQCGGCVCQHMDYASQLRFKQKQVEGVMRHIAALDVEVKPTIGMDDPWHYRNKTALPVACGEEKPLIGYYAQRSHRVVEIDKCLIAKEESDTVHAVVRRWMGKYDISAYCEETHKGLIRHVMTRVNKLGESMVVLVINGDRLPHADELLGMLRAELPKLRSLCISVNKVRGNVILGRSYETLWGDERLPDTLCGHEFRLSPLSFFQVNPVQTEKLYDTALKFAALTGDELVADVYCGAGTISLMLARHAKEVVGIEIVPDAIRDAKENAKRNGVGNAQFRLGAAEDVLPKLVDDGMRPDVIVIDPPRKGCEESVLMAIAKAKPKRVVYVSCNPATQARDAKILCANGYAAVACQPVDMFCQTAGVESVMLFCLKEAL
ncbi:MAG: 23S rRNA (uracil(1939)-C(5))-methyltransferase RlmD [Clostridia bacterium]|nr:23S rRNA (uracil(1939)-C(5))-methyltransferase RlmD [Clostridia bacterium]